jgi:hypothetical protein
MRLPKRLLSGLCALLIGGVGVACLYPFNFQATNHVRLRDGGQGLEFMAPEARSKQNPGGLVFAKGLTCRGAGDCLPGEISIALSLAATSEAGGCLRRIVDFRGPDGKELFYVGQWKSYLIVRSFSDAAGGSYREIGLKDALQAGRAVTVTIASGTGGTALFVDGAHAKTHPEFRLLSDSTSLAGAGLFLGNSPDLSCAWSGTLSRLSLHGRGLSAEEAQAGSAPGRTPLCRNRAVACFDFGAGVDGSSGIAADISGNANDLTIDKHLVFDKPVLGMPQFNGNLLADVVANWVGFIPIGMAFALWFKRVVGLSKGKAACGTAAAGFFLSLMLETVQAWLPGRDSSLLDMVMNTFGSFTGAVVALAYLQKWTRAPA